jgi:hypothetical protein
MSMSKLKTSSSVPNSGNKISVLKRNLIYDNSYDSWKFHIQKWETKNHTSLSLVLPFLGPSKNTPNIYEQIISCFKSC